MAPCGQAVTQAGLSPHLPVANISGRKIQVRPNPRLALRDTPRAGPVAGAIPQTGAAVGVNCAFVALAQRASAAQRDTLGVQTMQTAPRQIYPPLHTVNRDGARLDEKPVIGSKPGDFIAAGRPVIAAHPCGVRPGDRLSWDGDF